MKDFVIARVLPAVLAGLAIVFLYQWLKTDGNSDLIQRLPGQDSSERKVAAQEQPVDMTGELITFETVAAQISGEWPRFRGSNFDAISRQDIELAASWPQGGPKVLWSIDVGEGHAGAAIMDGRVFLIDYDRANKRDVIRCLSLADGNDIWQYSYPVKVKRNHGMSRTVPAVTEKYIVTIGPKCHVTCLDSATGEFKWMLDLVKDFNTTVPPWYAGQCPIIDGDKAIIAPGGDSLVMAVDCNSGQIIWKSPNPKGWKMTHSSIMPAEFMGKRMYVYCGSRGVTGINAEDGNILWLSDLWKIKIANVPSPVVVDEGLFFLSGGYNSGAMILKLSSDGQAIVADSVFKLAPEVFGSPQHTPVFYKGFIYGVRPDGQLACLDIDGNVRWTSSSANKFGIGPYMVINDFLYVCDNEGLLSLIKATPESFQVLTQAKVLEGPDSWGPMATAGGRLIVRDLNRMVCLDITSDGL
ncbi:PQQ-binding-like beta-propeller repeat protein [Planctomycetota bacterium]